MSKTTNAKPRRFTIGREQFQQISAVEGIHLDRGLHEDFREFDRNEVPASQRRSALAAKYGRKS